MRKALYENEAKILNLEFPPINKRWRKNQHRYPISDEEWETVLEYREQCNEVSDAKTKTNQYKNKKTFVITAWNDEGYMMDIDEYCTHYKIPRKDISSYKLVTHTAVPYYNIAFRENQIEKVKDFDFDKILSKYTKNIEPSKVEKVEQITIQDFNTLTYTDVHIGMDTDKYKNSMYAVEWSKESILNSCSDMAEKTLSNRNSDTLIVDELGDFLDGFNAQTTRGGHSLPQNMTNEEAFDCALDFKIQLIDMLYPYYKNIIFNNICNDNHAGAFGYFVNKAFKEITAQKYPSVKVNNHRKFLNHYFVGNICFIITHGKDDSTLKFGFKPQLDTKSIEKIDQYCKHNKIYQKAELIVFKKGDSHQALFDMCSSDDFYYFNYPALSPSSQWVQNNFKKGRRGFVLESFLNLDNTITPIFVK